MRPDAMEVLPRLVWHYDEPFADSSAVPTWYVSQLTRQHVTVALTGDGGDELFAGYPRYLAVWLAEGFDRLPGMLRRAVGRPAIGSGCPSGTRQKSRRRQFKRFRRDARPAAGAALPGVDRDFRRGPPRAALQRRTALGRCPTPTRWSFSPPRCRRADRRDAVTAFSLADLVTYLPCDLMTKVDIASMAHGLECRQPFLDYRVVELAARMPRRLKFRRGRGKRILRETFADLLPEAIQRRPKMGFGVPLDHWFRHELRDFTREVLFDQQDARARLLPARGRHAALGRAPAGPLQPRLPALVAADPRTVAAGVVRRGFLALVMRAKGPAVHPAQGNALGRAGPILPPVGPTGQPFVEGLARWADNIGSVGQTFPRALPLGWVNHALSGQPECRREILQHSSAVPSSRGPL